MSENIKEMVDAVLKYIDEMEFGESTSLSCIMDELGLDVGMAESFEMRNLLYSEAEKTRDYIMDMSAYDDMEVGLPQNIPFVKMPRK